MKSEFNFSNFFCSIFCIALLIFNDIILLDPLFPLSFLVNSWVPGMFDAMFQATFLCALLLFWLCIYHGIRQVNTCLFLFFKFIRIYIEIVKLSVFKGHLNQFEISSLTSLFILPITKNNSC